MEMQKNVVFRVTLSTATAFLAGYITCGRILESRYKLIAESEIADIKEHYEKKLKDAEAKAVQDYEAWLAEHEDEKNDPSLLDAAEALTTYRKGLPEVEDVVPAEEPIITAEPTVSRVTVADAIPVMERHDPTPTTWTPSPPPEEPRHKREIVDKSKPYIVPVEEFLQNEKDWAQATLTYYQGDDTLVDEEEKILDDRSRLLLVGTHLSDFGEKSNDENAVYLKNEKVHMYFEVVRDGRKYSEHVAGLGDNAP